MAVTSAEAMPGGARSGFLHGMTHRQLDSYPDTGPRYFQLGLVVLVTVALYYESYVGGSVSTLLLSKLSMSFTFYVLALAIGNLLGAFASLVAGVTDRMGRANLIVGGLLVTGVMTAFVIPAMTSKWPFIITTFIVGIVEGIVLVATPALVRDFSPQTGRATAMGFWTMGPVLGSLVVSVVGSATINDSTQWPHEYRICGVVGIIVFVIAFVGLRELAPSLRDQLMVSTKDRVLVEARAKGINIEDSLKNPWGQMIKADIIISALGVAVLLLAYYTAVGFGTILFETIFGFSLKDANGLGNWTWAADAVGLLVIGVASDRVRVRKPFMVIGGLGAGVMMIVYLSRFGHHTGYYEVALIVSVLSVFLAFAYAPWMASFTETVEARNPALTGTGLAVWGWILRVVVFVAFIILPHVINTVTPLVSYGGTVSADATQYAPQLAFAQAHPALVAQASKNATQLQALSAAAASDPKDLATVEANGANLTTLQRYSAEVTVIAAHPALFTQLAADPTNTTLQGEAITAAGGGTTGVNILTTIAANKAAITKALTFAETNPTAVAFAQKNATVLGFAAANPALVANATRYSSQLGALAKVPTSVTSYLGAHAAAVQKAAKDSPGQWKDWYWICVAACLFFVGSVFLMRGRWSPRKAREDEEAHEKMVDEEMARLSVR
jgi:ACS family D-galactonate transporter-like MFS transporter